MKTTKRRTVRFAIVAAIATTAYASAASLGGVASESLGAGSDVVQSCDDDGLTISYAIVDIDASEEEVTNVVTDVIVDDIAPTCAGGRLLVTVTDDSGSALGSGSHPSLATTSQSVAISSQPSAESVTQAHVVILGP